MSRSARLVPLLAFLVAAAPQPATSPATDDPRPGLRAYFDALRRGDVQAAFGCWCDDVGPTASDIKVPDLVRHLVADATATARFEAALAERLPAVHDQRRKANLTMPTDGQLADAQFTVYRRLAVVRWGPGEDDGFPMVLDNADRQHPAWRLSMQQWHETTRSSVGDTMLLLGGVNAKVDDAMTADVLAGRVKTEADLYAAVVKHLREAVDAMHGDHPPTTAPADPHP